MITPRNLVKALVCRRRNKWSCPDCGCEVRSGKYTGDFENIDRTEWRCYGCDLFIEIEERLLDEEDKKIWRRMKEFDFKESMREQMLVEYIQENRKCEFLEAKKIMENMTKEKGWDWVMANFKIFLD